MIGLEFTDKERGLMAADWLFFFVDLKAPGQRIEEKGGSKFVRILLSAERLVAAKAFAPPVWEPANKLKRPEREEDLAFATVADPA